MRPAVFAVLSAALLMTMLMAFGVLGAVMLPVVALMFATALFRHLVGCHLRRAVCEVVGIIIFLNALYVVLRWGDDVHFYLCRPFYLSQVAAMTADESGHKKKLWRWDGSMNTDTAVYYDDGRPENALPRSEDDGSCKVIRRSFGGHFELTNMVCYR